MNARYRSKSHQPHEAYGYVDAARHKIKALILYLC
jgi:hypothetical protein